mgnify:CR=1 FL=1
MRFVNVDVEKRQHDSRCHHSRKKRSFTRPKQRLDDRSIGSMNRIDGAVLTYSDFWSPVSCSRLGWSEDSAGWKATDEGIGWFG